MREENWKQMQTKRASKKKRSKTVERESRAAQGMGATVTPIGHTSAINALGRIASIAITIYLHGLCDKRTYRELKA